jgi:adenylate cyclase
MRRVDFLRQRALLMSFAWLMPAAGLPPLRVTLHCGTVHPQFLGATYTWWRTSGRTQAVMIAHKVADLIAPRGNRVIRRPSIGPCAREPSGESSRAPPSMAEGLT